MIQVQVQDTLKQRGDYDDQLPWSLLMIQVQVQDTPKQQKQLQKMLVMVLEVLPT